MHQKLASLNQFSARSSGSRSMARLLSVYIALAGLCLFGGVFAVPARAQSADSLVRNGNRWVHRDSGSVPLRSAGTVRMEVSGRLEISSAAPGSVALEYSIEAEAEAPDRRTAARRLSGIRVVAESSPSLISLGLIASTRQRSGLRVRIRVPEQVKVLKVRQLGGDVVADSLHAKLYAQIYAGEGRFQKLQSGLVVFSGGGDLSAEAIRGDVEISSGGGSVSIHDVRGEVRTELGGGNIEIRDVSGPLEASTGGGNVVIHRAGSSVFANTQGGLLEIHSAAGPVVARNREGILRVFSSRNVKAYAPTGPIQLLDVDGSISVSTATGNIYAELSDTGIRSASRITSEAGDITIVLPERLKLTVEAESRCPCGKSVISDFPASQLSGWESGVEGTSSRLALNGGGTALRVITNGGRVFVKKARPD